MHRQSSQPVDKETLLFLTASTTNYDLPAIGATYSLKTAPTGIMIDASTGRVEWTPTEEQGPGVHNVTVRVTDTGPPALGPTTGFTVTVNEVNLSPSLGAVPDGTVHAGTSFNVSLSATDPDLPVKALSYSLVSGPEGATASSAGLVSWVAPAEAEGTTADFTVRVSDSGVPALMDDRSFKVTVVGPLEILASVRSGGQLEVSWTSIPGRTYRLVTADSLPASEWTPVPGNVLADDTTATKSMIINATPGETYFRVELIGE